MHDDSMIDFERLIYLRPLPNSHSIWLDLAAGKAIKLSSRFAIDSKYYSSLQPFSQQLLEVVAAGRTATKSIVVLRSAARIHGLWVLPPVGEKVALARRSQSTPARGRHGSRWRYYKMSIPESHQEVLLGARCTSVARTCVDIARLCSFEEGVMAMDSALRYGKTTVKELQRTLEELGRVKGIAKARAAAAAANGRAEAPYESYAYALLIKGKVGKAVVAQYHLEFGYRADLCVDGRVIIEIDGRVKYDGTTYGKPVDSVIVAERDREKQIQNLGYIVLRYTPAELLRNPERFLQQVKDALDSWGKRGLTNVA